MLNTGYPTGERKAMHARLKQLTGRWLLTEEARELEILSERLGVPLQWRRFDMNADKVVALGDRRPQETQSC